MDPKYTATIYNNDHLISSHGSNDLCQLTASLLLHLDNMVSGSRGFIKNNEGDVVRQFCKRAIEG